MLLLSIAKQLEILLQQRREKMPCTLSVRGAAAINLFWGKSNEIIAISEFLDIEKSIITLDTMGCQREIAKQIIRLKADYVLALKGNHSGMKEEL